MKLAAIGAAGEFLLDNRNNRPMPKFAYGKRFYRRSSHSLVERDVDCHRRRRPAIAQSPCCVIFIKVVFVSS